MLICGKLNEERREIRCEKKVKNTAGCLQCVVVHVKMSSSTNPHLYFKRIYVKETKKGRIMLILLFFSQNIINVYLVEFDLKLDLFNQCPHRCRFFFFSQFCNICTKKSEYIIFIYINIYWKEQQYYS